MFNCFDSLFFEYCQLRSAQKKKTRLIESEEEITSFIALILIILCGIVLVLNQCESSAHMAIGHVILICALAFWSRIAVWQKTKPSVQQYSDYMSEVVKILERHGIFPNDAEKIEALIEFSSELIERRNPLSDIKRALTIAGSTITAVWSILANGLNAYADLMEYLQGLLKVALFILVCSLMSIVMCNIISYVLFPQKKKYQQLIDDLKQISIFYTKS